MKVFGCFRIKQRDRKGAGGRGGTTQTRYHCHLQQGLWQGFPLPSAQPDWGVGVGEGHSVSSREVAHCPAGLLRAHFCPPSQIPIFQNGNQKRKRNRKPLLSQTIPYGLCRMSVQCRQWGKALAQGQRGRTQVWQGGSPHAWLLRVNNSQVKGDAIDLRLVKGTLLLLPVRGENRATGGRKF